MRPQVTTEQTGAVDEPSAVGGRQARSAMRGAALRTAIRKRADGVPTYSVPEAAALLSISQEYLYRLIQADAFPAVRMRIGRNQGRYVVPAKAVENLLEEAAQATGSVDSADWAGASGLTSGGGWS